MGGGGPAVCALRIAAGDGGTGDLTPPAEARGRAGGAHLLGHPVCGHSWEGYCIAQILAFLPSGVSATHYQTHAGAEVDLVLEDAGGRVHAIEIKRTLAPKLTPAFRESMTTLGADRGTYLMPGGERFPLSENVTAINLLDFLSGMNAR